MFEFSLDDPRTLPMVVEAVRAGKVVGANLDEWVYVVFCSAWNKEADAEIRRIKGEKREGYLSAWLDLRLVPRFLDLQRVNRRDRARLNNGNNLVAYLGARALLRYPVRNGWLWPYFSPLPPWLLSGSKGRLALQQFSFDGNPRAFALQEECVRALRDPSRPWRLSFLAATSMNYSREEPTIVEPNRARAFCFQNGIELLVHAESSKNRRRLHGSYPLVVATESGLMLKRWQFTPGGDLSHLFAGFPNLLVESALSM